jgi:hypothetical protein
MKYALGLGVLVLSALSACTSVDAGSVDSSPSASEDITAGMVNTVDRPNRSIASATMQYYGGSVIANPKVYVVWWGSPANLNADVTKPVGGIADFFAGVLDSPYMDSLSEYNTNIPVQVGTKHGAPGTGQMIGRGNYAGTITLTAIPPGNVTDDQIAATVESAITAGTLPQPDTNTLYAIYFPRNVKITLDGSQSCVLFGAYHYATPANQHQARYAVMPDCGYSFSGVTRVTSHELAEAVTDAVPTPGSSPDFPQAWNTSDGNEVGDLCTSSSGTITTSKGPFSVQGIWDESSHGCKVTHPFASDFSVVASGGAATLTAGAASSVTFQTATVAGAAQPLTLSVIAPAGVTASLSSTTVTSGDSVTVTLTTAPGTTIKDGQVIVQASGTGTAPAVRTAALLVQVGAQ